MAKEPITLAKLKRPDGEVRVSVVEYGGAVSVDIRQYWPGGDKGKLAPTRRGIRLRRDELSAVITALLLAAQRLHSPSKAIDRDIITTRRTRLRATAGESSRNKGNPIEAGGVR